RAADIRREALGPRSPRYGSVLLGVGNARRHQDEWEGAAEAYREGIDIFRALGPVPAVVLHDYAEVLRALGRVDEARAVEEEAEAVEATRSESESG
ncbi:MAG: tetratricopeptide repeat protein, partial [Gemmatimonadota bacterium]